MTVPTPRAIDLLAQGEAYARTLVRELGRKEAAYNLRAWGERAELGALDEPEGVERAA